MNAVITDIIYFIRVRKIYEVLSQIYLEEILFSRSRLEIRQENTCVPTSMHAGSTNKSNFFFLKKCTIFFTRLVQTFVC